jgi:ribonucleoside-diphosphate reductase alpha chain
MFVIKRKGHREEVNFNKILKRIQYLILNPIPLNGINAIELTQQIIKELHNNISTTDIDNFTAKLAASLQIKHIDYGKLAGRIAINNHQKNTLNSFLDKMTLLYLRKDKQGKSCPLISNEFYKFVLKNQQKIEDKIDYSRDYNIDFFGFKTLEKSYLLKIDNQVIERPQDLWMRVAIFVHYTKDFYNQDILEQIFKTYDAYSNKLMIQASPTLFNSGLPYSQNFSCFLLGTEDSLEGINKTFDDMARISKWAGGIGVHISNYRATGTMIRSTNGPASGIVPILRMFDSCMNMYNQGGKRPGNAAIYLEPHHADIMLFLDLKRNHGDEKMRARDLFYAMWLSDLFMKRVENDEMWSLFCPDKCPQLNEVYSEEYEKLYTKYEQEGLANEKIPARKILKAIYDSMKETGTPYICFKDTVNKYNMQSNIGIIKSSNLCSEIMQYSNAEEYAVCCLGNLVLQNYVFDSWSSDELQISENQRRKLNHEFPINPIFDYKLLVDMAYQMTFNLDNLIDKNHYPVIQTARSCFLTRAIGIGVQGLADVFMKFKIPFESPSARQLNKNIFEAIHYGSLSASVEICRQIYKELRMKLSKNGEIEYSPFPEHILKQYPELKNSPIYIKYTKKFIKSNEIPKTIGTYPMFLENLGSPLSQSPPQFHWELYGLTSSDLSGLFDWESLREKIAIYGIRHSLLNAAMPTASTSQIMGSIESFEPYKQNLYVRRTQAGEFIVGNEYLFNDLKQLGFTIEDIKNNLIVSAGSIQHMNINANIKALYKTAFEMQQKSLIEMARDRQPFIDQSQSMNLFFHPFEYDKQFYKALMYAWKNKLKTGSYYIRTRSASAAQNFTIDPEVEHKIQQTTSLYYESEPICKGCE